MRFQNYKITKFQCWGMLFSAMLVLALLPSVVLAETVVRTGDSVSIMSSQVVENDLYAAGGSVTHSGQIREDLYVAAGTVTINGLVGNDLTAFAGTVQIQAPVQDDARIIGGDVVISEDVGGDVFVIGGLLKVLSSATVSGNVYFYGGNAEIEGVVDGSIMGKSKLLSINGEVGGVDFMAAEMSLGDRAVVRGDVRYTGATELNRSPGAVVEGKMLQGADLPEDGQSGNAGLIFLLAWVFTTLVFYLLLRPQLGRLLEEVRHDSLRIGIIGIVVIVGAPILSVILLITVLGAWIGLVVLLLTLLLFLFGFIVMPSLLGGYLVSFLLKSRKPDVLAVLVGIVVVIFLSKIPVLGPLLIVASFILTIGAIMYVIYKNVRRD